MAKPQSEKVLVALAGEYLVAGNLCLMNYMASLTLKNYPKVDIFCLNPKNNRQVAIQVKCTRGSNAFYLPEEIDDGIPFVFVYIKKDNSVDYFIVPADEVAIISKRERDEYLVVHPNVKKEQPRMISLNNIRQFKDKWELLDLE